MNLDRNEPENKGKGKYALVLLRKLNIKDPTSVFSVLDAINVGPPSCIDLGLRGSDSEFFVIRLKDKYAAAALEAYAKAIFEDIENNECNTAHLKPYASQIVMMAERAKHHPARKLPD